MLVVLLSLFALAGPLEDADAAFAAGEWKAAAKSYRKVVKAEPDNARAWFRLSSAQHASGDWRGAITSAKKALEAGFPVTWMAEYNIACAHARAGQPAEATAALKRALDAGFSNPEQLGSDADLESLRGTEGWEALVAQARKNAEPCMHDPRFRQFDFFVGDWVLISGTREAGTNHIEKVQRGCAILESWTGSSGHTGTSLSTLDAATGRWSQLWMSDGGWRIYMEGGVDVRGHMVMTGPDSQLPDKSSLARTTWAPKDADTITYIMEASEDGGETWAISFEGIYHRKTGE